MNSLQFRWESELSDSFLENTSPALWTRHNQGTWVKAQESTCSEGRADLVWGKFAQGWPSLNFQGRAILLQNATASRILATLRQSSAQFEKDLLPNIGVTTPTLRKWLNALLEAEFITHTRDGRLRAIPRNAFPSVEICSFELKLKNWQRALYQATRYRSFSHRVFVVMPIDSASTALKNEQFFRKANIGLVAHDRSGLSRVLIRPKKRSPNASYRTIMALGMFSKSESVMAKPSYGRS